MATPRRTLPGGRRSRIYRDAEVWALLDTLWPTCATISEIHGTLTARFGADRCPSRTAIGNYVRRARSGTAFTPPDRWGKLE